MTTTIERDIHQPSRLSRPTALPQKRRASLGDEQGVARDRSKPVARGRASPIRAWRAADTDSSVVPGPEARTAAEGFPQSSSRDPGAGARPGALERAARMRAIEQAWKEEQARQAELDAEE